MTLLSLRNVNVSIHDTPILKSISFELAAGEVLGVVGESGSGKSITALAIMGLLPAGSSLSGEVRFADSTLNELEEAALCRVRGDDIGMVFQEPMTALNPVHSIGQQVAECIRLHQPVNMKKALQIAADTLTRCGLPPAQFPMSRYPHELSGGQRQRVVIAMAVALKPRLLIADEPTTALDVTTQAEILNLLKSLQHDEKMALMLISHDLAVVASMADEVVIMNQGSVVEQGLVNQVFAKLKHPYTRSLFEASNHTPNQLPVEERKVVADAAESDTTTLLDVTDLVCEYGTPRRGWLGRSNQFRAVDGVSFSVLAGESVGLVGESGCGKSTLARAVLGLMKPASGRIEVRGRSISEDLSVLRHVQVVFQDPYGSFNPRHKVSRLVAEPLNVMSQQPTRRESLALVVDMLESVGLTANDADKYIHEFSGGQRQRIAIARALIVRPALIVLDEAVSALDVSVRATVLDLLASLAASHGLAYLFISHDLSVVRSVTDRVLVMESGKVVEQGNTDDVFDNPTHEYTQRLVASVPQLPDYVNSIETK